MWFNSEEIQVRISGIFRIYICICAHFLPQIQPPGNIGVGVVLFIGPLMKLRLDSLCLYWKFSRDCIKQVRLCLCYLQSTLLFIHEDRDETVLRQTCALSYAKKLCISLPSFP